MATHVEQHKEAPRFRQGLIVALFCFLLAFFFYLMAVLEIRRTEKAILGIYKSNAIRILETLELISGSKARHFIEFLNKRPIDLKEIEAFEEVFHSGRPPAADTGTNGNPIYGTDF